MGYLKMESVIEIEKIIGKKNKDEENVLGNILFTLMTNLHQPYSEIMKMPLPLVNELLGIIDKENKKMEKEMNKKRR
jgi:hypothetical protein